MLPASSACHSKSQLSRPAQVLKRYMLHSTRFCPHSITSGWILKGGAGADAVKNRHDPPVTCNGSSISRCK
jgi:hypothetical protein